jgi:uncharacterized damage-inducible protein DinB
MTNKEFFIHTFTTEKPLFVKVIKAVPQDKFEYRPGAKGRTTGSLTFQLAAQPAFIAGIAESGRPPMDGYHEPKNPTTDEIVALFEKNADDLIKKVQAISDSDWETSSAILEMPGGKWESKKYDMAWNFFFDAIHHRGQLTAYLRAMGAVVPGVYGPSADEGPQM